MLADILWELFWGSASCCAYFIKVIRRTVPRNNSSRCLFIYVSVLVGHLQAEYNTNMLKTAKVIHNYFRFVALFYCIPPEDGHQGPKHVAAKIYKINTLKSCCEGRSF
jgi:hypothetical protein